MTTSGPCTDVGRSLPLNLCCVCASQSRHEREQMLPLGVLGHVVQLHRQTADRAREALRHVLDPANRPVLKATATKAPSLMQVPPSFPGNGCEPALSFQFRM